MADLKDKENVLYKPDEDEDESPKEEEEIRQGLNGLNTVLTRL
jgi:hypothetical protein